MTAHARHARIDFDVLLRWNELTKRETHVYTFVVGCRNTKTGRCDPGRAVIAAGLGIGLNDVWEALKGLTEKGWLTEAEKGFEIVPIDAVPCSVKRNVPKNGTFPKTEPVVPKNGTDVPKNGNRRNIVFKQTRNKQLNNNVGPSPDGGNIENISNEKDSRGDVEKIFDYYKLIHEKGPRFSLTDLRRKRIAERLKKYSVSDIFDAIDGCRLSPHHQGQNETGTIYDDIELICRNDTKLEMFIEKRSRPLVRKKHFEDVGRNNYVPGDDANEKFVEWSPPNELEPGPDLPAEVAAVWSTVLEKIEVQLNSDVFKAWFRPVMFDGIDGDVLLLRAPQVTRDWINLYYSEMVDGAVKAAGLDNGREYSVVWTVDEGAELLRTGTE